MNERDNGGSPKLSFAYCIKWWMYYHTKSLKGRFEVYHFLQWLLFMACGIAILEAVLYVWLNV